MPNLIEIADTNASFWAERIKGTFGFAGGTMTEIWQSVISLRDSKGRITKVVGTQNPLWCFKPLFDEVGEDAANASMFAVTAYAAKLLKGESFKRPDEFLRKSLGIIHYHAKEITGRRDLPETFTLNALVPIDWANWVLYKEANNIHGFAALIPPEYQFAFSPRQHEMSVIPLMSYSKTPEDIAKALDEGYVIMKLKIGHATEFTKTERGSKKDLDAMLEKDMERVRMLHEIAKDRRTELTRDGRIPYYFDANGRYDEEHLVRLLEFTESIGALDRLIILEEPLQNMVGVDFRKFPRIIASDECCHSVEDVTHQISQGARYIALKPAAKTPSVTMQMMKAIYEHNQTVDEKDKVYPFVADLTVVPSLVQLNMAFASRLPLLPGMKIGAFETNGHQHYERWEQLLADQPRPNALWARPKNGVYHISGLAYNLHDGGIFEPAPAYLKQAGSLVEAN